METSGSTAGRHDQTSILAARSRRPSGISVGVEIFNHRNPYEERVGREQPGLEEGGVAAVAAARFCLAGRVVKLPAP
jgi:hypothetical protein